MIFVNKYPSNEVLNIVKMMNIDVKIVEHLSELTKTSYCILMRWQPRRLVGGSGGTNSCSDFQSSVLPARILPRLIAASSRDSVSITLFFVMYWIV